MTNPTPTDFRALCAELVLAYEKEQSLGTFAIEAEWIARRARAALAQQEPEGPTDEELLAAQDQAVASFPPIHPDAQALTAVEYARELEIRKAHAVLARYARPAIEPVPVSERLPEPEDCDGEGRCWFWADQLGDCDDDWGWKPLDRTYGPRWGASHWLPHWALPVPQQP